MKGNVMRLCCLLFLLPVIGSKERACTATGERKLTCKFSQNVNSTQTDFGVFFYPDSGGEEPLLDCAWVRGKLHCIKQEGFVVMESVSDRAELLMPKSFVKQNGSYRCVIGLDDPANIRGEPCRFSERKATVATITQANKHSIFTVKQDVSTHPKEHSCHPDHSSHQLNAEGCESSEASPTEVYQPPVLEITLPAVVFIFLLSVTVLCVFCCRLKKRRRNRPTNV